MTREELEALSKPELVEMLKDASMPTGGNKLTLIDRILGEETPDEPALSNIGKRRGDSVWCPYCDHSYYTARGFPLTCSSGRCEIVEDDGEFAFVLKEEDDA